MTKIINHGHEVTDANGFIQPFFDTDEAVFGLTRHRLTSYDTSNSFRTGMEVEGVIKEDGRPHVLPKHNIAGVNRPEYCPMCGSVVTEYTVKNTGLVYRCTSTACYPHLLTKLLKLMNCYEELSASETSAIMQGVAHNVHISMYDFLTTTPDVINTYTHNQELTERIYRKIKNVYITKPSDIVSIFDILLNPSDVFLQKLDTHVSLVNVANGFSSIREMMMPHIEGIIELDNLNKIHETLSNACNHQVVQYLLSKNA